uniref:Uncharacterized protein n=1 Tax=Arundo donax TaxID=35708 RepID=A0A0A9DU05_ARUDO
MMRLIGTKLVVLVPRRTVAIHGHWCKILCGLALIKLWNQCLTAGQLIN